MRPAQWITLLTLTLLHCGGVAAPSSAPAVVADGGAVDATSGATSIPTLHRPTPTACSASRPSGTAPGTRGDCQKDADCTKGTNGRCVFGPTFSSVCSYDECASDADCGAGVCDCRNAAYHGANVCFRGNCTTDGDCGGGYCSPSGTNLFDNCRRNVPAGAFGYFCHTPKDTCTDDADCEHGGSCIFSPDTLHWQCLDRYCTKGGE